MTEIFESKKLVELVIEKHNRLLETFNSEYSGLEEKLKNFKHHSGEIKEEMTKTEERIMVLNEKYHLLFHQAKKQREEIFNSVMAEMRKNKVNHPDIIRIVSRIEEIEKKLQTSKNIEEEDKMVNELKDLLSVFSSTAGSVGINMSYDTITGKLDEANSSHKELLEIAGDPEKKAESIKEYEIQIKEIEGRYNWLKNRIESHNNALVYWEEQNGEIKIE